MSIGAIMDGKQYFIEWIRMAVGAGLLVMLPDRLLLVVFASALILNLLWLVWLVRQKKPALVNI